MKIKIIIALSFLALWGCSSNPAQVNTQGASGLVSLDDALAMAAEDVGQRVQGKTEIAITGIEAPLKEAADFLTGELTSYLVAGGKFIVLERSNAINAVDAEHQFQMSGMVSDDSAVGIGYDLGAKVVLSGTFSRYANFSQLRLRAIDVRSTQLLSLYTVRIRNDDEVLASVMRPLDNVKPQAISENALASLNRGQDFLAEGKYDAAIREFEAVLRLDPNNAEAKRNIDTARQRR